MPGVKLVVKTLPSESFSRMEQLKSLDAVWNLSSSLRVWTSFALFSMTSWRFSTLRNLLHQGHFPTQKVTRVQDQVVISSRYKWGTNKHIIIICFSFHTFFKK
jgi:hypothetical protein